MACIYPSVRSSICQQRSVLKAFFLALPSSTSENQLLLCFIAIAGKLVLLFLGDFFPFPSTRQTCASVGVMKSLRFSSLQSWLWRKGSKQEEVETEEGRKTSSKERKTNEGSSRELAGGVGDSSSASNSASSQEALDWAIGWYEPHGPGFCSDDNFAVLVPCYASPPQSQAVSALSGSPGCLNKSQLWADVLSKVAMETKAETAKRRPP